MDKAERNRKDRERRARRRAELHPPAVVEHVPKMHETGASPRRRARVARSSAIVRTWPFDRHAGHRTRSARLAAFITAEAQVPSGRGLGKPYQLLPFQRRLLRATFDDPRLSTVMWQLARGAGKTGLVAALLVAALYEREGADIIIASTGMRTSRLAYDRAVRIIETNQRLAEHAMVYRNGAAPFVELPARGSRLQPLPSEPQYLVGQAPSLLVVDEVGFVLPSTYQVLQTALGKVDGSLLLGVGTPGLGSVSPDGQPNIMWQLRQLANGASPPRSLRYLEHSAPPGADPGKVSTWRAANPGLGRFVSVDAVRNDYQTMPASTFAMFRLARWVEHEAAWVRAEAWDALAHTPGLPAPGAAISLGFDGSSSTDSTALVAFDLDTRRLHVLGSWAPPERGPLARGSWRVPRSDVEDVLSQAFARWRVVAMYADPWLWRGELQRWQDSWGADVVRELDTSQAAKMGPAADAFRGAVENGRLSSDGDVQLRAHVLSAVARLTRAGDVLQKDARQPRRIDLAIAAVLAHEAGRQTDDPMPAFY